MKYLKKFNEKLKSSTYSSAAKKMAKLGHLDRSKALKDWAIESEKREDLVIWKKNLDEYGPFGLFNMNITNRNGESLVGSFALEINFDADGFSDSFEDAKSESEDVISSLCFFIGLIPANEEVRLKCEKVIPKADFSNGLYWGNVLNIDFSIKNGDLKFTNFRLGRYEEDVNINDRQSAQKFKTLLKNIFSDPELKYPSGYTDVKYLYEKLESTILMENSFSSEYGFELENTADFINTISPNTIYKSI